MRILVTGATGYVGSRLVAALLDEGHDVVAATRNPEQLGRFGWCDRVSGGHPRCRTTRPRSKRRSPSPVRWTSSTTWCTAIGQPGFRDARQRRRGQCRGRPQRPPGCGGSCTSAGSCPTASALSEHLAGRAEVAAALNVEGGAELVWLGAAVIIGAGSTSFEMVRYVGDRFWVIPLPPWADHDIDPISIRDVLYYLLAAADPTRCRAGAYDIVGPDDDDLPRAAADLRRRGGRRFGPGCRCTTSCRALLIGRVAGAAVPVPTGLAADLIESLDHPMTASDTVLRDYVPDPPGGLTAIDDAVAAAVSSPRPCPVDELADPHHLADSDPVWAGGDALRLRRLAAAVTPAVARPVARVARCGARPAGRGAADRTGSAAGEGARAL